MERLVTMSRKTVFLLTEPILCLYHFCVAAEKSFCFFMHFCMYHLGFLSQVSHEFMLLGNLCVNVMQFLLSEKRTQETLVPLSIQHCVRVVATECLVRLSASFGFWKDPFVFIPISQQGYLPPPCSVPYAPERAQYLEMNPNFLFFNISKPRKSKSSSLKHKDTLKHAHRGVSQAGLAGRGSITRDRYGSTYTDFNERT